MLVKIISRLNFHLRLVNGGGAWVALQNTTGSPNGN